MRRTDARLLAVLPITLALLSGCGAAQLAAEEGSDAYRLDEHGDQSRLMVEPEAVDWLGIHTEPVTAGATPALRQVPLAAVLYGPDGSTFVYAGTAESGFERRDVDVDHIDGDRAVISAGPEVGDPVVTQGAAELTGMEFGLEDE